MLLRCNFTLMKLIQKIKNVSHKNSRRIHFYQGSPTMSSRGSLRKLHFWSRSRKGFSQLIYVLVIEFHPTGSGLRTNIVRARISLPLWLICWRNLLNEDDGGRLGAFAVTGIPLDGYKDDVTAIMNKVLFFSSCNLNQLFAVCRLYQILCRLRLLKHLLLQRPRTASGTTSLCPRSSYPDTPQGVPTPRWTTPTQSASCRDRARSWHCC